MSGGDDWSGVVRAGLSANQGGNREGALLSRVTEEEVEVTVYPMLFGNLRLCVGEPGQDWFDRGWCFEARFAAECLAYAATWNGVGVPEAHWHRDLQTGDRREFDADGETVREWVAR